MAVYILANFYQKFRLLSFLSIKSDSLCIINSLVTNSTSFSSLIVLIFKVLNFSRLLEIFSLQQSECKFCSNSFLNAMSVQGFSTKLSPLHKILDYLVILNSSKVLPYIFVTFSVIIETM